MFAPELDTPAMERQEADYVCWRDWEGSPLGERHVVPADLASIPPGPYLAAVLSSIDRSKLSGHDLVLVLQAHDRLVSHFQAARLADMAELAYASTASGADEFSRREERYESASWEIRAALRLTRRSADAQLDLALEIEERFPKVIEWLSEGIIEAQKRYEESLADRRVASEANVEGTANIFGMELEPHRVSAAMRRINTLAKSLKKGDETRTMDQLRADIFMDLLVGKSVDEPAQPRGVVDITVDLTTLVELNDSPGEVGGFGPVIADIARQVAAEQTGSEWRWTLTDRDGGVMANGTTKRRPDAKQRRYVQARDATCVFPGCRAPATECEIDHNHPWALGGPTHPDNEAPLCRHDNMGKEHGWKLRRLRPGVYRWTSPLGHVYITESRRPP